jgi:mannose-6-phosphate isomerase-like protein (cupin superfamily)
MPAFRGVGFAAKLDSINRGGFVKALIRIFPLVLGALFLCVAIGVAKGGKAVVWPAGDVKWTDSPTMKGSAIAPLWGDPNKGAYGALKKVAAGTDLGWHTHTSEQRVISVSGTIDFTLEGQEMKSLTPGSYVFVPGGTKHKAVCQAGADCIWFEEQPGKTDWIPAK